MRGKVRRWILNAMYRSVYSPHPVQGYTLEHRWQTQGSWAKSSPPPCFICPSPRFYLAAAPSSLPLVKEQLHLCSLKITFGPLKATARLMWPPVKMSLTSLLQRVSGAKIWPPLSLPNHEPMGLCLSSGGTFLLFRSKALYELIVELSAYIFPVCLAALFLHLNEVSVFHIPYNLPKEFQNLLNQQGFF